VRFTKNQLYDKIVQLIDRFFYGDKTKTSLWLKTSNPLLGDVSPNDMIRFGRSQKLLKFILYSLQESNLE